MSQSDLIGPEPRFAEDGNCINTKCTKRNSNECPVFRLKKLFVVPKVSNILDFPKSQRNHVGFSLSEEQVKQIDDPQVTKLDEERSWKEIEEILLLEDAAKRWLTGYQMIRWER